MDYQTTPLPNWDDLDQDTFERNVFFQMCLRDIIPTPDSAVIRMLQLFYFNKRLDKNGIWIVDWNHWLTNGRISSVQIPLVRKFINEHGGERNLNYYLRKVVDYVNNNHDILNNYLRKVVDYVNNNHDISNN
ncbi:hypothetical protein Indivirus_1_27 [Indivirus ILV1]|uniref:Uncharacterized protein n=1 Tax=Indivirus ILV1 TaxID=1977633 RepID=A0A1V0SCP6_9VIRU|nr:hypothetical protein Indivirus_1_27 [Indivirus ILV1]